MNLLKRVFINFNVSILEDLFEFEMGLLLVCLILVDQIKIESIESKFTLFLNYYK